MEAQAAQPVHDSFGANLMRSCIFLDSSKPVLLFYPTTTLFPSLSTALAKLYPRGCQGVAKLLSLGKAWLLLENGMATPVETFGLNMATTCQVRFNALAH